MRYRLLLIAALLAPATPSVAQVTVDLRALDALPAGHAAPSHQARPRVNSPRDAGVPADRSARPAANRTAPPASAGPAVAAAQPSAVTSIPAAPAPSTSAPSASATSSQATATPARAADATPSGRTTVATAQPALAPPRGSPAAEPSAPPPATMAAAPPPVAQLAPVVPATSAATAPPPPPPIDADAATKAAAMASGVRVTFAPGKAELSPASADAIKELVASAAGTGTATFNVVAYAAATPDDPSLSRRLSLSRALAVRSALMADGVVSSHIYVRALGAQASDGPPDRVDVSLFGSNAPAR